MADVRRAQLLGTGLIGGSVARGLREQGWHVTGRDLDPARQQAALDHDVVDAVGTDGDAELVILAMSVGAVPDAAAAALDEFPTAFVTDVGSVKSRVVEAVSDPRFVGGHPMAGSEQQGVESADAKIFEGAVWVLTPTADTNPAAYALVHGVVTKMGAEVLTLDASAHDEIVAMVSHVPHLAAASLMRLAGERAEEQRTVLRMAAGGFRDMTRIAAGAPGIWPDICVENADAICDVLDDLIAELGRVRQTVVDADRPALLSSLEAAREARANLPTTAVRPERLAELRVSIPDEPGQLSRVTTTATELSANIYDIEIAHSVEGPRGVLILVIDAADSNRLGGALEAEGYHVTARSLT
jgi:prephenate dehydrogenase